jgi:hypothetical protein
VFIMRKRYGVLDVAACVLMSLGLSAFTLVGSHLSPNFHYLGNLWTAHNTDYRYEFVSKNVGYGVGQLFKWREGLPLNKHVLYQPHTCYR